MVRVSRLMDSFFHEESRAKSVTSLMFFFLSDAAGTIVREQYIAQFIEVLVCESVSPTTEILE